MMPVKTPGVPKMVSIPGGQYQQQYMDMMNNRFENAESENSSTPNFGVDSTNFGLLTKNDTIPFERDVGTDKKPSQKIDRRDSLRSSFL